MVGPAGRGGDEGTDGLGGRLRVGAVFFLAAAPPTPLPGFSPPPAAAVAPTAGAALPRWSWPKPQAHTQRDVRRTPLALSCPHYPPTASSGSPPPPPQDPPNSYTTVGCMASERVPRPLARVDL